MIVIIDFSNLSYSSFFSCIRDHKLDPEVCPVDFREHIHTFSKKVNSILRLFSYEKFYFALDRTPKEKYRIFADYKKGRKKLDINPKAAPLEMIEHWGSNAIYAEDYEADDAIAAFVANNYEKEIIVVTTDKDLWQVCEYPHTKVYNFHKNMFITRNELIESFKLSKYSLIKLHKALWGDSSDGVPNAVPRMQKQLLPLIEKTDGTLVDLLEKIEENKTTLSKRCLELLRENEKQIKINYELVRLNYDCGYVEEELKFTPKVDPLQLMINEIPF